MTVQPVGARCTEHGSHTFFAAFFFLNEFRTQNRRLETRHITDTEVGKQQQETLRHTSQGTEETTVAHTTRCWPSLPGGERRARPHKPPHPSHLKRKKKSTPRDTQSADALPSPPFPAEASTVASPWTRPSLSLCHRSSIVYPGYAAPHSKQGTEQKDVEVGEDCRTLQNAPPQGRRRSSFVALLLTNCGSCMHNGGRSCTIAECCRKHHGAYHGQSNITSYFRPAPSDSGPAAPKPEESKTSLTRKTGGSGVKAS